MTKTEELYARATRTSHLKIGREEETPRDAERILAAGSAQTRHDDESHKDAQERSLGVLLARLRIEWDAVSSEIKAMHRNEERSRQDRALAIKADEDGFDLRHFDEAAARDLNTARALIMMNLRSLEPARLAMLSFALTKAERQGCGSNALKAAHAEEWWSRGVLGRRDLTPEQRVAAIEDHAVAVRAVSAEAGRHHQTLVELVGQVVDAWLDRLCYRCEGRGFTGGWSSPKLMCPSLKQGGCAGTGSKRSAQFGASMAQQMFALWLLNVMDSKVVGAMGRMAAKNRQPIV